MAQDRILEIVGVVAEVPLVSWAEVVEPGEEAGAHMITEENENMIGNLDLIKHSVFLKDHLVDLQRFSIITIIRRIFGFVLTSVTLLHDACLKSNNLQVNRSGVKPVDKREGGGAHNWGNHKDDIAEQLNTTQLSDDQQDWTNDKSAPDTQSSETVDKEAETGVNDVDPDAAQHTEEEPKELTLDEYKALRGNRQKPTFNLRKAGEGEDLSQWKKMYALNKKKEGEEEEDEEDVRYLVTFTLLTPVVAPGAAAEADHELVVEEVLEVVVWDLHVATLLQDCVGQFQEGKPGRPM
uniref:(California timema) hypothetical protein n=1 Tax=Timema californicum TaxID=61474 RepID=A0A7R9J3I5_TIMCA|nr:unnamed protein product [Timema californicum]